MKNQNNLFIIKYKNDLYTETSFQLPDVYYNIDDAIKALEHIIDTMPHSNQNEWFIVDINGNVVEFKFKKGKFYDINVLQGLTITDIDLNQNANEIKFYTDKGTFKMFHDQDCCETVEIEDICGDLSDLIGCSCLAAYCTSNKKPDSNGDEQWTFYHIATIKGSVTIRWYGTSNGYYSVGVDFQCI